MISGRRPEERGMGSRHGLGPHGSQTAYFILDYCNHTFAVWLGYSKINYFVTVIKKIILKIPVTHVSDHSGTSHNVCDIRYVIYIHSLTYVT